MFEIWRNVLRLPQISATDNFFLDLGGHSLLAANVVSKLRGHPEFINLSMADFYANPTVQKLSLLAARAESINEPSKVELPKDATFVSNISLKTITIQSLGLYVFFGLPGLMLTGWYYLSKNMTKVDIFQNNAFLYNLRIDSIYILIGLFLSILYIPTSILIAVTAKWLLIGRYTPGQHPLWGNFYLRWWLANAVQSLVPVGVFAGSPIRIWYCRLMGAKIGKNCYIGTGSISCCDLIHIGDDTSIGNGSQLMGYSVTSDSIEFNTIDIGRDCYVGANSFLSINTVMGDGSMLLEQSMLASGSVIPPKHVASGSPARTSKIDQPLFDVPGISANEPEPGGFKFITGFLISGLIFLPLVPALASIPGLLLLLWI